MPKDIVKFPIGDENEFISIEIESDPLNLNTDRVQKVSRLGDEMKKSIETTKRMMEDSIENIGKMGATIVAKIRSTDPPDEIDIQFGLKFSAEAGLVIANVSSETHLNISMKWKKA